MKPVIDSVFSFFSSISQIIGILVVSYGMLRGFYMYLCFQIRRRNFIGAITRSRMELGHSFSLGLGFLIGASIIKTTLAPSWNDIGKLAAIIAIRTIMNYFLIRDTERLNRTDTNDEA